MRTRMADAAPQQPTKLRSIQVACLVVILFFGLTLLLSYPVGVRPASGLMGDFPDGHLFLWMLAWNAHAFIHQPLAIFDANIFYPNTNTLAYSENLIGTALLAAPIMWVTDNPVIAMNLVSVLSCALCGIGGYVLGRKLRLSTAAAIVTGLVFAFAPARFFRIPQLHLNAVQWIPFSLAFLHSYLDTGRRRDLRLAAAFFSLQALSTGHGAVFLTVAIFGLLIYRVVIGEPIALGKRLRDLGIPGILLLVPSVLVYLPYWKAQADLGLQRSLERWGVVPESFIASPSIVHTWLHSFLRTPHVNETADAFLFPGYVPLALAIAALWLGRRGEAGVRTNIGFYVVLLALCVLLSIGPPLGIWPLVYWLPGFSFIRAPSRFVILGVLALAVLAGVGVERVTARMQRRWRLVLPVIAAVIFLIESAGVVRFDPYRWRLPEVDRWLATRPAPIVVAELPVLNFERYQSMYMLHSTAHWQKTVHGYSGVRPPAHDLLYRKLQHFPDEASLQALSEFGVNYVVVHADMYQRELWPEVEGRIQQFSGRLELEYSNGPGRVYALR